MTAECPTCDGSGEITEILGQDRVTGLIHDHTWTCRDCDGTGQVPALDSDGLTDEQYAALAALETSNVHQLPTVTAWECQGLRSCHTLLDRPNDLCLGCRAIADDATTEARMDAAS